MKIKEIFLIGIASSLLIASQVNATYIGSGSGNDHYNKDKETKEKILDLEDFTFSSDVSADDNFYFSFVDKYDNTNWDGSPLTLGDFTITGTTFKDNGEITGGSFSVTGDSSTDFLVLKAGSGFAIFSADGGSGTWTTEGFLDDKEISHFTILEGKGNISYPPGGGAQVPEPATIFLLGSGLLGIFGFRKKFWKSKSKGKE